ncbi:DUF1648 domain-containing protein [Clostridium neuense]|uniref:DUF1648 domain-containing protein n=1 Tax=Clostridium neuense TaxID=1728934 RepID=A0ABW8TAK9_9CLOT
MNDRIVLSLISALTMIISVAVQVVSLNASKKDIFLGIRIPESERNSSELKSIGKKYIAANLTIGIPVIVVFSVLIYKIAYLWLFMVLIFAFMFVDFLVYYRYNRMVSKLKNEKKWLKTKRQVVVIDTNFSKENQNKIMPSAWWFSISFLIVAACAIINIINYSKLPYRFPTHWGLDGKPNGYSTKSYINVLIFPLMQLLMTVIMIFSYKSIGWSKKEINPRNPEESKIRSIKFRKIWGIYIIFINYIMQIIFLIEDLQTMQIIKLDTKIILPFIIIAIVVGVTVVSVTISIKVGQGGSKLKVDIENKAQDVDIRDDDRFWKFGNTIYYNKEDPSVFVEKRFGVGWTVNAGSTLGKIFYIVMILILICSVVPLFFVK